MSAKTLAENIDVQDAKSNLTDFEQTREPAEGAYAVRDGMAPRHERAPAEERDALHDNAGNQNSHSDEGHHIVPLSTYFKVFGALMVLLVLTLVVYFFMDLSHIWGPANIIVAMTIAVAKAILVLFFFMHVKFSSKLTWIFASVPFVFVLIMFLLTMNDYMARGSLGTLH